MSHSTRPDRDAAASSGAAWRRLKASNFPDIRQFMEGFQAVAVTLPLLSSFALFSFSLVRWLKTGVWHAADGWAIASWFGTNSWIDSPTTWLGLHKLVVAILDYPLWISLPPLTFLALLGTLAFEAIGSSQMQPRVDRED